MMKIQTEYHMHMRSCIYIQEQKKFMLILSCVIK